MKIEYLKKSFDIFKLVICYLVINGYFRVKQIADTKGAHESMGESVLAFFLLCFGGILAIDQIMISVKQIMRGEYKTICIKFLVLLFAILAISKIN